MPNDQAATLGHNSNLTQDVFLGFVKSQGDLDVQIKALKERRKKLRKEAKAAGVELGHMDAVIKMSDWSREDRTAHFQISATYLEWLRSPIGVQFEMPLDQPVSNPLNPDEDPQQNEAVRERLLGEAEDAGYRAAVFGKTLADSPHEANSSAGQRWMKGWHDGSIVRAAESKPVEDDDEDEDEDED